MGLKGGHPVTLAGRHVDAVMFDLDGTLIDSRPGIEASVQAALTELGLQHAGPIAGTSLGAPLAALIDALLPDRAAVDRELAARAFMRHYDDIGWRSSPAYVGAEHVVEGLRRGGIRLFIVTNKRRAPTLAILAGHGLDGHFEAIYTPDSRVPRYASKSEMGQACIQEYALAASSTLVVGDSRDDLEMARACGTLFGAASWGYGSVTTVDPAHQEGTRQHWDMPNRSHIVLTALTDLEVLTHAQEGGESLR